MTDNEVLELLKEKIENIFNKIKQNNYPNK